MKFSLLMDQLINSLRCLPGVGIKTAQRMAFHLLDKANRANGVNLAKVLQDAMYKIGHCESCRTFSEEKLCQICINQKRDTQLLCIVEYPSDLVSIEQMGNYRGLYFVLMGRLSPLDGVGPKEIGIPSLIKKITSSTLKEIIIATNPTVEGEATAHYLSTLIKSHHNIVVSRIAHGVPYGGELEYIDSNTLARAFAARDLL